MSFSNKTRENNAFISKDEYRSRNQAIADVTDTIDIDVEAESGVFFYTHTGVGDALDVLSWAAKGESGPELKWREGFGCVHIDLDLPVEGDTQLYVAFGYLHLPTQTGIVAPGVALAHSEEDLLSVVEQQQVDLFGGSDDD